ncbi:MAG: hypothetical protein ACE5DK_12680 [Paracoccaceae bacterium]
MDKTLSARLPWIIAVILAVVAIAQQVKMSDFRDSNAALEQSLSSVRAGAATVEATLADTQAALESAQAALKASQDSSAAALEEAKAARAATGADLDRATAAVKAAEGALEQKSAELEAATAEVGTRDAELAKLKAELDAAVAARDAAEKRAKEAEHVATQRSDAVEPPAAGGATTEVPRYVPPVAGPLESPPAQAVCSECHTLIKGADTASDGDQAAIEAEPAPGQTVLAQAGKTPLYIPPVAGPLDGSSAQPACRDCHTGN